MLGNNIGLPFSNEHQIIRQSPDDMTEAEKETYHLRIECQALVANLFLALGVPDTLRLREAI